MRAPISRSSAQQPALTAYEALQWAQTDGTASTGDLWRILSRRRGLIAGTVLVLVIGALTYGFLAPPRFTSHAEIIVDPRDRQVLANDVNPSGLAPDGGIIQVESQVKVIQSNNVLLRAIAALHLTGDPEFNGTRPIPLLPEIPWFARLLGGANTPPTQEQLEARTLQALREGLAVKRPEKVFVIDIIFTANEPAKAARVANAIADAYLTDQADAKAQGAARAWSSLRNRLGEQRARVQAAAKAVDDYRAQHNILSSNGQLVGEQKLAAVNAELTAVQGHVASLRAKLDVLETLRKSGTGSALVEALGSPVIAKLRDQEATVQQRIADLAARFGSHYPAIDTYRQQLGEIHRLINEEVDRQANSIQTEYDRAVGDEKLLSSQFDQTRAAVREVIAASVSLHELERELDANRSVYSQFMERAREIGEQVGIDTTNARVITRALPPLKKSWPSLKLLLLGAIGGGISLGCGFALAREYANPTLLTGAHVEAITGARVIGTVPVVKHAIGPKAINSNPLLMEGLGLTLRHFAHASAVVNGESQTIRSLIVISGEHDREYRRSLCRLFAWGAKVTGERVLLVDPAGDDFGTPGGLQEVLQGRCKLDAIIDVNETGRVAFLGHARRGPPGMMSKDNWKGAIHLIEQAQQHFDLMIVDGGVLSENPAAAPLLAVADEVVLVIQLAGTPQEEVRRAVDSARLMGRQISAVVLVDPTARSAKKAA